MSEEKKGQVIPVDIEDEMKIAYLDYAMSVIVGRALPDARDGLKPVHRRVLYAMHELGLGPEKAYKKSARVVGEVLGKYHPHGDSAVYDTLVRMAQDFSLRYLLVDGHGNFGSVDGDSAAAMRYTEVKMTKLATELLADIEKETVDFRSNFDDSLTEPVVLPARLPNLLLNGSAGIAVGMATNIPPHNLKEVVDGVNLLLDHPQATIEDIMAKITGPDFPTAALIVGKEGIEKAYKTGNGSIIMRGVAEIEENKSGRSQIIIREIPYQVNKASLIEKIAELVKENKIEGIQDLRDESDRDGMRIVIDLKRKSRPKVVLNLLYKHTRLQTSFGVNMLALVNNEPKVLNLKSLLQEYIKHQQEVVTRRTEFLLGKAEERAHILEGLKIALDNLDRVIALIRGSEDVKIAREGLIAEFLLTEIQAQAILDMRLQKLTGLEIEKVEQEYQDLRVKIAYYKSLLADKRLIDEVIKKEINEITQKYQDPRRTKIIPDESSLKVEDLIPKEDTLITLTHSGYINRMPLVSYKAQHRGGRGIKGMNTKDEDFVIDLFMASTHDYLLFFTNQGRLYRLKVHEVPENYRQGKGIAMINLLPLQEDENITAVIPIKNFNEEGAYLIMATVKGIIKKTALAELKSSFKSLRAITLRAEDELIAVRYNKAKSEEVVMATLQGKCIRFSCKELRPLGRTAVGVKGISLANNDQVVGMEIVEKTIESFDLMTASENGFSKRTIIDKYRTQKRGGKGLIAHRLSKKTGFLAGFRLVKEKDDVIAVTQKGRVIRFKVNEIKRVERASVGVKLMRLSPEDKVVSLIRVNDE